MTKHRCDPPLAERPRWTCAECNTRWRYVDWIPSRHGGPYGWAKAIIQPWGWFPSEWWR